MEQISEHIGLRQIPWGEHLDQASVGPASVLPQTPSRGARVKISRGLFAGSEGIVETDPVRRLLVLSVQVLGRAVLLEVDPSFVEMIS